MAALFDEAVFVGDAALGGVFLGIVVGVIFPIVEAALVARHGR